MHLFEHIVNLVLLYQTPQIFSEYFDFLTSKGPRECRVRWSKIFSRTWLARQWLFPRTCAKTNSVLNVYLVFKIRFIRYRFLKSTFRPRGRKRNRIAYANNRLQRFLVPLVQSCFMPRHLRHMIYQLNYGVEYLGFGKVMWYQQRVSTQIARVPRTYVVRGWKQRSTRQ
jgi:hypothetical protein